ncbi:hypothetical protein EDD18DRAFT_1356153 [Armillaria luteobubalina]|uniref:Uncharacterized protein n=1 Tax=Armillaria luteobubalina TaxID=153913 RepID=A0AA39Q1V6_9AGAR|nr:hypothetical protein EDD18DRAFT_1356153 [Armillaria luteobubalina]
MVTEWSIIWDTCVNPDPNNNCTAINVFFDTNFSPSDPMHDNAGPYSNNKPMDPIFLWNATYFEQGLANFDSNSLTFRAELTLFTNDVSYLSAYPFDSYYADIVIFAQDVLTNDSVSVDLSTSYGLISGIKTTTDAVEYSPWQPKNNLGVLQGLQGAIHIYMNIERSALVIAYCLIITITFWMVTLVICLIMIATVFFGFRQRNEIVVVPIGTVFAFTQLRASMPGAPDGFGDILDFAGVLPCFVLLSISAITMVGIYLFANPDNPSRRTFTWNELKDALYYYIYNIWDTSKYWVQCARFRILSLRWNRKSISPC